MKSLEELEREYSLGSGLRQDSITDRLDYIFKVLIEILRELRSTND